MIHMKSFMEMVQFRITDGSNYGWSCYGDNAYSLDSWDGYNDSGSFTIIFDTKTQEVYEVQAFDYCNERAYRYINPAYRRAYFDECNARAVAPNEAWDNIEFVDLEVEADFLEKGKAIFEGRAYDTRIQIPISIEKDLLHKLMQAAHEKDISLNDLINRLLKKKIKQDGQK